MIRSRRTVHLKPNIFVILQLNTLYWHVADSQSFPLEVSEFPELSNAGAYSASDVYSESDVQDIINYAAEVCAQIYLEAQYQFMESGESTSSW